MFNNFSGKYLHVLPVLLALSAVVHFGCHQDYGLTPYPPMGEIHGRIQFEGAWPDSTLEVRVIVLHQYPRGITDLLQLFTFVQNNLVVTSDTIPRFVNHYDYQIQVPAGEYEWLLVAWFPDISSYYLGVKELGAYYTDPNQGEPSPIGVSPGEIKSQINMTADFANVFNVSPFFKKKEGEP